MSQEWGTLLLTASARGRLRNAAARQELGLGVHYSPAGEGALFPETFVNLGAAIIFGEESLGQK